MSTTPPSLRTATLGSPQVAIWLVAVAAALSPAVALAHTGVGVIGGFQSGFTHPIFGFDHVVAMVAVGLWGAFLGQPAIWLLPVVFPVVMAFGGLAGVLGVPRPGVELGIAFSAVALGAMVALALRPPLWVAAILVGAFAIFHGHAHGTELPEAANPLAYGVGFVIATGLLHLSGIVLGLLARWPAGLQAVRVGGAAIACVGLYFLAGALTGA
jgi:urease accessory protein